MHKNASSVVREDDSAQLKCVFSYGTIDAVLANVYSFNTQSKKMFESLGFYKTDDEWYRYDLREPV